MKKQSVDVLDEADRFERVLDWQLFKHEQDARVWAEPDMHETWTPGDPIHKKPVAFFQRQGNSFVFGFHEGGWPRPLMELFDYNTGLSTIDSDEFEHLRWCPDCDVLWYGFEGCWLCGEGDQTHDQEAQAEFLLNLYSGMNGVYELPQSFIYRPPVQVPEAFVREPVDMRTIIDDHLSPLPGLDLTTPEWVLRISLIVWPEGFEITGRVVPPAEPPFPPLRSDYDDGPVWSSGRRDCDV